MNNCQDNESGCLTQAASDKRRRLVQGIGAGVLTVTAKSSLATTGNCLSPSASASISLLNSRPNRDRWNCTGRTPGFWFNAASTHPLDWQYAGQTGDGEVFSTVFLGGFSERLRIVMGMTGNQDQWQLGAHLSAAYLNLRRGWVPEAVMDLSDLRAMWAGRFGTYSPTSGVSWGGEQIVSYLKTTMPLQILARFIRLTFRGKLAATLFLLPPIMDRLIARRLDDGVLVFDNDNGSTHLLSYAAWELLSRSQENRQDCAHNPADADLLSQIRLAGLLE